MSRLSQEAEEGVPMKKRILIGPPTSSGRLVMRKDSEGNPEFGHMTYADDGKSIPPGGELAILENVGEDGWGNATTLYTQTLNGPAQVATPAYREGYDRIFGKKEVGLA